MLPIELLEIIFQLACDDDGLTARSIAFTSWTFYSCSIPLIYRNIAIYRAHQLERLLGCVRSTPRYASFIKNAFIAETATNIDGPKFQQTLNSLLKLISPTLLSLTLFLDTQSTPTSGIFQTVFDTSFPLLTSLMLCGDHTIPHSLDMPALRRFHSAGLTKHNAASCFAPLTKYCPHLSHIRISMASQHNLTFAISAAFDLPGAPTNPERMCLDSILAPGEYDPPPFPSLPQGLISLIVKPAAPPMAVFPGCTSMFYSQYIKQLHDLKPRCPSGKFRLLPAFKRNSWEVEGYDLSQAKNDWLGAIQGRTSAWSTT
ncbi:hypothetical protein RhiJN_25479 [Ceratobasidium sp. AG-Ba]|nr:hypothetical protein RhiJN_25479 [Ceratobasidium sp. AG-Ba]